MRSIRTSMLGLRLLIKFMNIIFSCAQSFEMQYGRVSCINSLQSTPLAVKNLKRKKQICIFMTFKRG